jgi:cysteine desulfuration protein SufE
MSQQAATVTSIDEILENFELLDDWEDRYRYVIELGNQLEPLSEAEHSAENKVRGCASQVWMVTRQEADGGAGPRLYFRGDSDAHIVRGLIAILLAVYSGRPAGEILETDAEALFGRMGLRDHLTQQRSNGLASMVARLRADAAAALDRP